MGQTRCLVAALVLLGLHPSIAMSITFDDGTEHVVNSANSFPFEAVVVRNSPIDAPTTLRVIEGAEISTGADAAGLQGFDDSILIVEGGTIGGQLVAEDNTNLTVTAGTILGSIFFLGNSTGVVDGVEATHVNVRDSARATILGGNFPSGGSSSDFSGTADILGGSFDAVLVLGAVAISGGRFSNKVESLGGGVLEISGGNFNNATNLLSGENSIIEITGASFNFPAGHIAETSGVLTGLLADGHPISVDFARASTGTINLVFTEVTDSDGDGFGDSVDNCPMDANPDQADTDMNGVGNACNDAEDSDSDDWADNLDNCPDDPNDQTDTDGDGIGDPCDAFPDDPNNELAMCEADLDQCLMDEPFPDADQDGEHDSTDRCPSTPPDTEVDDSGCSQQQFCESIEVDGFHGAVSCRRADWRNDEPVVPPRDCLFRRLSWHEFVCRAWGR